MFDRRVWQLAVPGVVLGEPTVFIAPAATDVPAIDDPEGLFDERWELLFPRCPDAPPKDRRDAQSGRGVR